jgi:PAS domain S-box-containing protein
MAATRVLVVEDEKVVAEDLAATLRDLGYEVSGMAGSGEEAVRLCRETVPDIVLMDIVLPGKSDGIATAGILRSFVDIAVVFVTARTETDLFERAKLTGSHGYLSKPVSTQELKRAIEMALFKHSMEKRLRQSEERLKLALDGADLGLWDWDLETREALWDERSFRIVGYEPDEVESNCDSWKNMIHPEDRSKIDGKLNDHLDGKAPEVDVEYRIRSKQGDWRWVQSRGKIVERNSAGKPLRIVGTVLDVTERKKTERALQDSELRFRTMFRTIPDAVCLNRLEGGVYVDANQGFSALSGYSREEVVGKSAKEVGIWYDSEALGTFRDTIAKMGEITNFRAEFRRKDGSVMVGLISGRVMEIESEPFILSVTRDIDDLVKAQNALEESEKRFRVLVETAQDVIWTIDPLLNYTYVSPAVTDLLGYSVEEIMEMNSLDTLTPSSREKVLKAYNKEIRAYGSNPKEKHTVRLNDIEAHRKDGTSVWVEISTTLLRDPEGNPTGVLGVSHEITHRKEAEQALQAAHDQLEERVRKRTLQLASANEELSERLSELHAAQEALTASEERFRAIVETAPDCIFIKDKSLRYTFVNPSMAEMFGLEESEILGRTAADLFGPSVGAHIRDVDSRVLRGEVVEEEQTRPVAGSATTFIDIRAPMRDSDGQIIGICGISRNITERRTSSSFALPQVADRSASQAMRSVLSAARLAAETDSIVLLTGESGAGKDYLARYIHRNSDRAGGPFYAVNCAAIPSELAESELFGHEAGAFTGANRRKRGLLELAEGGTLLLNELGELSFSLQTKLLTFLDTRSFTRVGGEKNITVHARLIAATNRDLEELVSTGVFRKDLFYRLNVFSIEVPPLRERTEDIPGLVEEIVSTLAANLQLPAVPEVEPAALEKLRRYPWPGNIRELRNILEAALILSRGEPVTAGHLRFGERRLEEGSATVRLPKGRALPEILGEIERTLIEEALERSSWRKTDAALSLGISRFALARHMKKLGLAGE